MLIHVVYMLKQRTSLTLDDKTSEDLGELAEMEGRKKVDELRFLIKKRMEEMEN